MRVSFCFCSSAENVASGNYPITRFLYFYLRAKPDGATKDFIKWVLGPQGQQVVVNSLQQRYADQSNVSIDEEMANLLKLQTAYGANARVLSAVRDMLDQLLKS